MNHHLTADRLAQLLAGFPRVTIGLVGDLYLDRYLDIAPVHEVSIETGLEAHQVERVRNSPGAMGTIINNLVALGVGAIRPLTVIGDDGEGYDLLRCLRALSVHTGDIIQDRERQTPTYTKPMKPSPEGGFHELSRLDLRTRGPLIPATSAAVTRRVRTLLDEVDGLIVLDQVSEADWGVINAEVREQLNVLGRQTEKLILVDSRARIGEFLTATLKPNRHECCRATGRDHQGSLPEARSAATELARRNRRPVFCTLGENGILLAQENGESAHWPALNVPPPIDIVGAGDSVTAALTATLLAGGQHEEAAQVANLAASITIQQIGTTGVATPAQIKSRWHDSNGG